MKYRIAVFTVMATLPLVAGSVAAATDPPVSAEPHVMGAALEEERVNADGVKFQTKAPTDVSVLTLTVAPGGSTGWHSHPGLAIISVAEGTGTLYFDDCTSKTYAAGQAFVEDGKDAPTLFRNETSEPVVLTVTFVAPEGADIVQPRAGACGLS